MLISICSISLPGAGLQDFGAIIYQQHQESSASSSGNTSGYSQQSSQQQASAALELDVFDLQASNLTASVENNYDASKPPRLEPPTASHSSGLNYGPVGGGSAFQGTSYASATKHGYQQCTAPYYEGLSYYGQYPPHFQPSVPLVSNYGAPNPPHLFRESRQLEPDFLTLFPPGGVGTFSRDLRPITDGEDISQSTRYMSATNLTVNQQSTGFQRYGSIYGQCRASAANFDTSSPIWSLSLASGSIHGLPNPPRPVSPALIDLSHDGAQHGSESRWRRSSYSGVGPDFGPVGTGNGRQDMSPASTTKQYQPAPTPHYDRHDSPSYEQHRSQSRATPESCNTGVNQPAQDKRAQLFYAGDAISSTRVNRKFRFKVGSPAGTAVSSTRRKKGAQYKCGVEGCHSTLTSQANLDC
ncbi:hypothetical protein PM082_013544 [Marasmius tenuissimus]|nr:hypothetical protein PM082_013544 [Marasmius tenuissimus]